MNVARTLLCLLGLAVPLAAAHSAMGDSLSVHDAIELVLSTNPSVRQATQAIEASRARVELSRSGYLPSAEIGASYNYMTPVPEFILGGASLRVAPKDNYDAHIGARQTIYDFQRTASLVSLSTSRVALAENSLEAIRRDLSFRTVEVFYAILFLRRSIIVQDEQISTLEEHLEITRKKIDAGTALQLDAMTTQVRVANATMLKINLETALRTQETAFRKLAGLLPDAPVMLVGEISAVQMPTALDSLVNAALSNRIEEKNARDAIASAQAQQEAARQSDAPSLDAFVSYGVKNGYVPNLDVLRGNFLGGVQLTIPVLDGSRSRSLEEEAAALVRSAEAQKQETDKMIQADVEQALTEVTAAMQRVTVTEVNIEQAYLAVRTAKLRYEAGTVPNLDVLDALADQTQARLTNLQSRYDEVISGFRLRRAIGAPVF
jgi:outer membrane protein